ncbi:MAG: shikimate kinase [Myxococcota bacterium]
MRVFLTGFMGAGKSSVGRLVGELLHLPFVDLDGYIEEQAGRPIAEIFSDVGEVGFRALESEALVEIAQLSGVVVATGGGIVGTESNRQMMHAAGTIVWLDPDIDTILSRLSDQAIAERPLLGSHEEARRLWQTRVAHYEDCDLRIRVHSDEGARAVAGRVVAHLTVAGA